MIKLRFCRAIRHLLLVGSALLCAFPLLAQEIKIGLKTEPTALDPQFFLLTSNLQVAAHIFEGLTRLDEKIQVQPSLAQSWRAISQTVWEFKLRSHVTFSDGSPFTAQDVVFSINRVAKVPNSPSSLTIHTRNIDRVEIVDPLTVHVH
ncbi:MAG TPA: ABC transporter substrate-binding protein, partial [Variovorax sp.]